MGVHVANQTSFKKGEKAKNWNGFRKGMTPWNKGLRGVQAGENGANWRGGFPDCESCKKQLSQRHPKVLLCRDCYWKSEMGLRHAISHLPTPKLGEANWNWKGGITSKDRMERVRFRKTMQKQVFKRDNYKCTLCGEMGNLQVDHIQPWSEYVEGRFDMNNCRTLCTNCHYKVTFGKDMPSSVKGWGHNLIERMVN